MNRIHFSDTLSSQPLLQIRFSEALPPVFHKFLETSETESRSKNTFRFRFKSYQYVGHFATIYCVLLLISLWCRQ